MKTDRGFTLIEVLVAMTVMAVMAMMAWQGVDGIVRARDASQGSLERTLRLDSVVAQWDQDLASLQDANGAVPELVCDGSTVRMTRRAEGGLQVVAWALRPGAADFTWWRWASPTVRTVGELQDHWVRTQQLQGGETGTLKTITGLIGWQVYFYRGNGWSNCQSSSDVVAVAPPVSSGASGAASAANAAPREVLPSGVRMVLTFAPGSGQNGSLVRDTLIGP